MLVIALCFSVFAAVLLLVVGIDLSLGSWVRSLKTAFK